MKSTAGTKKISLDGLAIARVYLPLRRYPLKQWDELFNQHIPVPSCPQAGGGVIYSARNK